MDVALEQLPDDAATLKQIIAELLDSIGSLRRQNEQMSHRLQQLLRARFGPKAEKLDSAQLLLFAQQILTEVPPAAAPPDAAPKPAGHGRRKLPRKLPRKRVVLDVPEEERSCRGCGAALTKIGEETSEQIDYIPASVYVIETVRPKYACKACQDGTVVTAEKPRQPIEKGLPAAGMLAHVIVSKYADHLPLHRLEHIFRRHGLHLSRSTMCGWMAASARLLSPLYAVMVQQVLSSKALHTDDTPVPVLDKDRAKTRTGRLWTYRGDDLHPYTVYDYTPTRARDGPVEFLGAFEGYLHADAYAGYDGIYAGEKVIEVLCWAHARRKFFDARDSDTARATVALAYIRRLYQVERQAKELFERRQQGLDARPLSALRLELRQAQSVAILKDLEAWLRQQTAGVADDGSPLPGGPVLPKSPMGLAINYCLGNWKALTRYADDGDLDIDNNASERDLRPIAVGRKNYMFLGSDNGGHTAAVLYSLIATAKRHGLDPFAYLRDVIGGISDHPSNRLEELLPDHWKLALAAE
jgi:transposase